MKKLTLTQQDYINAGKEYDLDPALILAVAEIESRGSGFLASGEPVILFERHIFHRLTQGRYSARYPGISNRTPGGYGASSSQHGRLQEAVALDRDAALQSSSWGKFQVMGFNGKVCGYKNLQDFINAAYRSEKDHLDMFLGYCEGNNLLRHLRAHNWAAFARGYNGPGYAKNRYDIKLAAAYSKWSKKI